jgi:hypothetical protein
VERAVAATLEDKHCRHPAELWVAENLVCHPEWDTNYRRSGVQRVVEVEAALESLLSETLVD